MIDDSIFNAFTAFQGKPLVTAAIIGISRRDWIAGVAGNTAEQAQATMRDQRFDVLPVQDEEGRVTGYFRTQTIGDFGQLPAWCHLDESTDCLPYKTGLMPLLKRLAATGNRDRAPVYFLTAPNAEGTAEIVGMVADVNLNSRPVFQYGYAVLTELEMELSDLIGTAFPDEHRLRQALDHLAQTGKTTKSIGLSLHSFEADSGHEHQNALREYLSLASMLALVEYTGLYSWLGYAAGNAAEFGHKRSEITDIRNWIAHPAHSYERRPRQASRTLSPDTAGPNLLATRLYTALSAVDTMVRALKTLRQGTDLRTDRPRVGQYFTSRFFSVSQPRDAFTEGAFRLEPGVAAAKLLPADARSMAYLTPLNPAPTTDNWRAVDSPENQDRFARLVEELKAPANKGITWQYAASEARADEHFPKIRQEQHLQNMYREEGCWLLNVSAKRACELGRTFNQDAVIYAEAGKMAQLLACGKPAKVQANQSDGILL